MLNISFFLGIRFLIEDGGVGGWGAWIGEGGKLYLISIYVAVHVGDFENEYPAIQC